ncbi:restriction endonuclease subunit S [Salmonella enterica]|uniref:Restriction endonuclease subunit S n=1 Tax=Salmonella enterica subsp. salamae TaxID=59202 RepID=A0A8E6MHL6_SALER|nr:restriction endonuclease subunit S [Salmonella enterica]ECJ2539558.1 restriction endonuclease subunit S [Salmonella enterica subsp. salamae]ECJ6092420.1 restriction endonuclease subunit S [Salmonella enterica]QVP49692.1 restriction endonuclease subunit S [Salmonella enterica subsp. salamae]
MGSKWKQTTLGDLALGFDGAVDGPFGSNLPASAYTESGYPIIRGSNLSIGLDDFKDSDFVFVPEHIFQKLSRSECRAGDIIFTKKGTLGQTGLISAKHRFEKYLLSSNQMRLRVDPDKALPEYVYYYVSSQKAINKLIQDSECTGVPKINLAYLKSFPISLPSLIEQKDIIDVLGSLNSKITLNRQINQTLEQMSQTLFKSWFVDFDPVIDNALDAGNPIPEALQSRAELRQKVRNSADLKPLPADIRALFPAEFEETELGWMPKGWKEGSIPDIAFINSTSWGTKNQPDYVNYVDLSNAKDGIISSIEEIPFEDAPSRARRILKKDDLIFGLVRPANRSFAYVHVDGLTGSTGFAVIRAKNTIYKNFIYYFVTYDKNIEELARIADGGAYPAIKPDDICSLPLIIPPEEIVQRFDESTSNFRNLMNNSLAQNNHLTALRDTLLPKLISGELSLEDLPDLVNQTEPA